MSIAIVLLFGKIQFVEIINTNKNKMQFPDKLAHLVGDYQSDSDNDDTEHRKNILNSITTGKCISIPALYDISIRYSIHNAFTYFSDWTQCTDATTGHPYYWNIETKDVTWEMPPEYQRFLEQAAFTNSQSFRKWILCYTDDNAPYYFNEITREISWERPDDFIESSELPTKSRSDSRQSNISDSVSEQTEFMHKSLYFWQADEDKFKLIASKNQTSNDSRNAYYLSVNNDALKKVFNLRPRICIV